MRRDLDELLEGAAEQPSSRLDAAALVDLAMSRRRRRRGRAGSTTRTAAAWFTAT